MVIQEIHYIVTNLMYIPRALLSRLFLKICLFVLSLYTIGQLVTLTCEKVSNLRHYRLESEGKYGLRTYIQ